MENKINIAKILKDCPKGMELDCTIWDNVVLDHIDMTRDCPIYIRIKGDGYEQLTKYGQWNHSNNAKCVIFPKGKTTWEGFVPPCKFEDGDVIYTKTYDSKWISIFEKFDDDECKCYVNYCIDSDTYYGKIGGKKNPLCEINDIVEQRFAIEEEKEKLFQAIKDNGYHWNAETKTLEKLVEPKFRVGDVIQDIDTYKVKITEVNIEDECYEYESMIAKGIGSIGFSKQDEWELVPNKFDINTLKPFDKVLVRCGNNGLWNPQFFAKYRPHSKFPFTCTYNSWSQCVPYEGNEHLLDTTDDCDEFYKNW